MSHPQESYSSAVSHYTDDDEVVNYGEQSVSGSSSYESGADSTASQVPSEAALNNSTTTGTNISGAQPEQKKEFAVSTRWERQVAEHGMPRDFSYYVCCCARRIGNMFILCEKRDGTPTVIAGPCWPFCVGVTLPLIIGVAGVASYFVFFTPNSPLPWWVACMYYPVLAGVLICLFCVSCRDPGLMERVTDEEAGAGGWFWNEQVGSFRPPGALYCRECGVLIQDYDHLCPWTGTGIGGGNIFAFKAFVVGVNILCYSTIIIVAVFLLSGLFT
jgi:hypothetical protein